jgi:hypothetical protein
MKCIQMATEPDIILDLLVQQFVSHKFFTRNKFTQGFKYIIMCSNCM